MTGFGRSEIANSKRKIIIEMKAVNHRYCEFNLKMPKKLSFFEAGIRDLLKKYIQRGKVDIFITYEDYSDSKVLLKYNEELASQYYTNIKNMCDKFNLVDDVKASTLARFPEVLTLEEQSEDEDEVWNELSSVLEDSCKSFVSSRVTEGENLKNDLLEKLKYMNNLVEYIEEKSPDVIAAYREKLLNKITEVINDNTIDESRVATEVTIFADKICVDEETVRLRSHIDGMTKTLVEGGSVGRKLDFIAQEMNREANTILSKANDLDITNKAIDLKTEIEKVREQIQNIE